MTTEIFCFIELSPFDSSIISFVKNKQFHKDECLQNQKKKIISFKSTKIGTDLWVSFY